MPTILRNKITGHTFPATDVLLARAKREGAAGDLEVLQTPDKAKAKDKPKAKPKPVKADEGKSQEPKDEDEGKEDSVPGVPAEFDLADFIAQVEKCEDKDELEGLARENIGMEIDKRRGISSLRAEIIDAAKG